MNKSTGRLAKLAVDVQAEVGPAFLPDHHLSFPQPKTFSKIEKLDTYSAQYLSSDNKVNTTDVFWVSYHKVGCFFKRVQLLLLQREEWILCTDHLKDITNWNWTNGFAKSWICVVCSRVGQIWTSTNMWATSSTLIGCLRYAKFCWVFSFLNFTVTAQISVPLFQWNEMTLRGFVSPKNIYIYIVQMLGCQNLKWKHNTQAWK